MNLHTFFYKSTGVMGRIYKEENGNKDILPHFFPTFKSPADPFFSFAAIGVAPLTCGLVTCVAAAQTLYSALESVINILTFQPSEAQKSSKEAWNNLKVFGVTLFLTVISPFVQLIDFIGSIVKTIKNLFSPGEEEQYDQSYNCGPR